MLSTAQEHITFAVGAATVAMTVSMTQLRLALERLPLVDGYFWAELTKYLNRGFHFAIRRC